MENVVIIGGGFAGAYAAEHLEKDFNVTLVDSKNYFEFTPSVLRTIVEPEHIKGIQVLHRHYLKSTRVLRACVRKINERTVLLNTKEKIPYDYLVICSGSSYNLPIKEQNLVKATRAHHLRDCYNHLKDAEKILIIGGGAVGIELAAEIKGHYPKKDVALVHSRDVLIPRNNKKSQKYVHKKLEKLGVHVHFGERVEKKQGKHYVTKKGRKIPCDMAFLCTGIKPNSEFMLGKYATALNDRKQIMVDEHLKVKGLRNVFAAGDVTDRKEEKTAQNAEKQAKIIVCNLKALVKGKELEDYIPENRPMVISLGKYDGVLEYKNRVFTGLLPGLLKSIVEWKTMRRYR